MPMPQAGNPAAQQTRLTRSPGRLAGTVLLYLAGGVLVLSSALKVAAIPLVVRQMAAAGFAGEKLTFLAVLELVCAGLFLWPRSRAVGVLLVSSYLGGAICTHIAAGEYTHAVPPAVLLALAWIGTWLRYPQLRSSFNG